MNGKKGNRIGGKGTARLKNHRSRKVKRTQDPKSNEAVSERVIRAMNQKILALDLGNYLKFRNFLEGVIMEFIKEIKRPDINKKSSLRYTELNSNEEGGGTEFIFKTFFYPAGETKILMKTNSYELAATYFKHAGVNKFINLLNIIDKILVKKEHKIDLSNEQYKPEEFQRALNYFGIVVDGKVHFRDVRNAFEQFKQRENMTEDEKKKMMTFFTLIKNQYDDYLKSNDK